MQQYPQSFLNTSINLLEECIFLLFYIIGKTIKGRTNFYLFHVGTIVHAYQIQLIKPSKFIDIQFILTISNICQDDILFHVHTLVSDIEIDLIAFID